MYAFLKMLKGLLVTGQCFLHRVLLGDDRQTTVRLTRWLHWQDGAGCHCSRSSSLLVRARVFQMYICHGKFAVI